MGTGSKSIIKVLVVDDSPAMCKVLTDVINSDLQTIVAGVARNGKEAVEMAVCLKPDIITMDVDMPVMDGIEAIKQIMAYNATPILVVCASTMDVEMDKVFKAMSCGALDVIDKSQMSAVADRPYGSILIEKIKFLSGIKVIRHPLATLNKDAPQKALNIPKDVKQEVFEKIVAIAASTGGPSAILEVLKKLPKKFPCGIVIVQHITSGFLEGMVDWLNSECQIKVKVAQDAERVCPGIAYLAPTDMQMRIGIGGEICLSDEPPYNGYKPSGDVLLESVAAVYKESAIGVILTGMGSDGAMGIRAIKQMNGKTIAQDEKSCAVFGMPKAAIEMGAVDKTLPPGKISEEIMLILWNNTLVSLPQ
jgi:two-component system chemotaxis response regulator CheB